MKNIVTGLIVLVALVSSAHSAEPKQAVAAAPVKVEALVVASPLDWQVFQRQSVGEGIARVGGGCTLDCDKIEAHITGKDYTGKEFDTGWKDIAFDVKTRAFNAQITIPAGGWYAATVRVMKEGKTVTEQDIAHVGMGEVFIGAGQSNSTSCGGLGSKSPLDGRTKPESGMVTTFDGHAWRIADDPQPGAHDSASYTYGSFWPAFGDAMNAKYHVPIGVAVTGHGGTSIKQWNAGGELFKWTLTRMKQFGPDGFRAVLWHQGESDAGMSAKDYAAGLGAIIAGFKKEAGWDFPLFVAQATFRPGKGSSAPVRAAQQELWEKKIALQGPDTDAMLGDLRDQDGKGIHFSKKGLKVHGEAWAEKVGEYLDPVLKK